MKDRLEMLPSEGEVHLLLPLENPEQAVGRILAAPGDAVTILDLTTGHLAAISTLRQQTEVLVERSGKRVVWLDGLEFAPRVADASIRAQVEWVASIGDKPIADGRSLKEWFTYGDSVSLWWLTEVSKRHPVSGPYGWLFYAFFVVAAVIEQDPRAGAARWHVWARSRPAGEAAAAAIHRAGARARVHAPRARRSLPAAFRPGRLLRQPAAAVRYLARAVELTKRRLIPRRQGAGPWEDGAAGPRVLIQCIFPHVWQQVAPEDRWDPSVAVADHYFGDMPWRLRRQGVQVAWLPAFNNGDHDVWRDLLARQNLPDASAWMGFGVREAARIAAHLATWARDYVRLFVVGHADRELQWRGIPLGHWIREEMRDLVSGGAVAGLVQLERYRAAIEALSPDVVLHRNEFNRIARVLAAAGNGRAVLLGIQHGMLARTQGLYDYCAGEVETRAVAAQRADFVHHVPAPDLIATFGEYYDQYFGRWPEGFPSARTVPVGGVRHDRLVERFAAIGESRADRQRLLRRSLGLPEDGHLVLLCTAFRNDARDWFALVVSALETAGIQAFVAVKTHQDFGGGDLVEQVAEERGFSAFKVFDNRVYPLIACADVLVAGTSTTTLEAYLLGTPVIALASSHRYELYPFREERIGDAVAGPIEMAAALRRVLEDPGHRARFQQQRERVLRRHLNNSDAGACARLADLVYRCAVAGAKLDAVSALARRGCAPVLEEAGP